MSSHPHLRIARPTDRLVEIAAQYREGLGFSELARFEEHDGFDGIMLGHPDAGYHLEFTRERGQPAGGSPSAEHLLVFYLPSTSEWREACERALAAGWRAVKSHNPYWDARGRTFTDADGYRVVLQNGAWPPVAD